MRHLVLASALWLAACLGALAQESVWIQLEAQPSLREAEERARIYATQLPDVAGLRINSRWYGIAMGPYGRADAEARLASLRAQGVIPRDAYLTINADYQSQFYPVGARSLFGGVVAAPEAPVAAVETAPAPQIGLPDETPREARTSENLLSRTEKQLLQTALAAEGFYTGAIDGLFGRGTRASIERYQIARSFEPTGVLTTAQRAALIRDYNSILDGLGMEVVTEFEAGIEMVLPMVQIAFKEYEAPFVHYAPTGDAGISVSLVSQEGSNARFQGLFNILQTLDIVPVDGPRSLSGNRFTITGIDATRHTTVDVRYANGAMKGFILVWPAGDERRLTRVLADMRASFNTLPGTLDPALSPPDEDQSLDLLSGLDIRQPQRTSSGFFVDTSGAVLTAAEPLGSCERVSIGDDVDANIVFADAELGLALLKPQDAIAPLGVAAFQGGVPRLRDDVAVAGFSFGGALGAPTLTLGTLADMRGLSGDEETKRLELLAEPGDSGGPVFDLAGGVLGLLKPAPKAEGQILPENVRLAVDSDTIRSRLAGEGLNLVEMRSVARLAPSELSRLAGDVTVLVQCW